jgi:hypothetical protein
MTVLAPADTLCAPQELLDGDDRDQRAVLDHGHEVVADGRDDDPHRLRQDDPAERQALWHAQRLRRLDLAPGNGLNARPEDLGHVRAVVEAQRDDAGGDGVQDESGLWQRVEDEVDLDEERRPAHQGDVERGDRIEDGVRAQAPDGAQQGKPNRQHHGDQRHEDCDARALDNEWAARMKSELIPRPAFARKIATPPTNTTQTTMNWPRNQRRRRRCAAMMSSRT